MEPLNTSAQAKQSHDFLRAILNSAHYGIASYEAIHEQGRIVDFTITYTNSEVPGNFGMRPESVTGKTCKEMYPGIFTNGVFEKLVHTMQTGEPEKYEISVINPAGDEIWLTAVVEKSGNSVTVTSKNITEEKNAGLQLQEMNRLLQNKNRELEQQILADFSQSFISYKIGKDFFDSLLLELYEKTKMDFIFLGEKFTSDEGDVIRCFSVSAHGKIAPDFDYPLKDGPCSEVVKGKEYAYSCDVRKAFPKNATLEQFAAEGYVGYPLYDLQGKAIGIIGVMNQSEIRNTDYIMSLLKIAAKRSEMELDRQHYEKRLEEQNAELERKNKELESFNYIASHDLQEPLRKIQLFYSRILEKDKDSLSADSRRYFTSISNAADRMQHLIEALLAYSTTKYASMAFEKTDLNHILSEALGDLEEQIQSKNAVVESEHLPKIPVIPFQFRQLLINLLSNGIKYSKKNIVPIIRISATQTETVKGKKMWQISVSDNGIGFEQKYEHKIFELFQRLHGKQEFVGTGIGLAICKRIAENHKGTITVQTEPGAGSVFTISIPVKH